MTDERNTDEMRDERLAERLRVEPLDEVTRARLVRTAMAAAPAASSKWSARTRVLGVAAALVALLAVGLTVVLRDQSTSGPTAADAPKTVDAAQDRSRAGAADELQREFSTGSRTGALGDLGDVGGKAALRRAIDRAPAPAVERPAAATASPPGTESDLSVTGTSCAMNAVDRLGEVVAVGTGTADGEPVTVYVVERPTGSRVAVVVGPDCAVGKPVSL